jgi:hypothetical protein
MLLVREQPKYCFYCYVLIPGADLESSQELCEGTEVISYFPISSSLNYEASKTGNFFKYFDCYGAEPVVRVLQFDGYGVSLQLSLTITRCCWEARNFASFDSAVQEEELSQEYDYPDCEDVASLAAGLEQLQVTQTKVIQ